VAFLTGAILFERRAYARRVDTSSLQDRTVVVTGAGSGIGRETALLCARRGADVAICDVDDDGLAETERRAPAGSQIVARHVDVADRAQVAELAEAVHAELGAVDLLVNNAGVGLAAGFLDTTLEDWDWIVSVNVMGVVHGCHAFLPKMVERGSGHVVNLSSAAGYYASPTLVAYTATKFAVRGLSQAMREELAPHGIGVTAVCPGIVNTPITRSSPGRGTLADPEKRERAARFYERRNYGPEKVAKNILRAVERNRAVAPITPESWFAWGLTRLSPSAAAWTARRGAAAIGGD
jgi:NAD(P)-dependent dehydrogenase (short-subunit alcohol dehydrogenase family)